ncbi:hypothetical protein B0H10DRAFT_2212991 [Mycena sp. CBHHK59/15]|nr:hypothetical protein B0H10DRAFT_2212991 [Mycena sp. CBHHK59/15]
MKACYSIFLALNLLATVAGSPVYDARADARWAANRQAAAALESEERQTVAAPELQWQRHAAALLEAQAATRKQAAALPGLWAAQQKTDLPLHSPRAIQRLEPPESQWMQDDEADSVPNELLHDDYAALHTPAEIERNLRRLEMGLPPIPPKAIRNPQHPAPPQPRWDRQSCSSFTPLDRIHIRTRRGDPRPPRRFLSTNKVVWTIADATKYAIAGGLDEPRLRIDVAGSGALQLCVAAGLYGEFLGHGKKAFHHARHTRGTHLGQRPVSSIARKAGELGWAKDLNTMVQTSAFSVDSRTKEIEVHWANPDGSSPRTFIAMARHRVFFTGDLAAFEKNWVRVLNSRPLDGWRCLAVRELILKSHTLLRCRFVTVDRGSTDVVHCGI